MHLSTFVSLVVQNCGAARVTYTEDTRDLRLAALLSYEFNSRLELGSGIEVRNRGAGCCQRPASNRSQLGGERQISYRSSQLVACGVLAFSNICKGGDWSSAQLINRTAT